jgi:CubicO group peptidase (beta-lactamase class C family)
MRTAAKASVLFVLTIGLLLVLPAGCSMPPARPRVIPQGDYTYTARYASWLIGDEMRRHDLKGVSIGLVDDQRLVWAAAFGWADVKARDPARITTVYRVGSISKLLTVCMAMRLVEQGQLDLDAPITRYLPEFAIRNRFPAGTRAITARDLMTHHSGLPSNYLRGMWSNSWSHFDEVIAALRNEYAAHPPGYVFAYSNLGMALLGRIVERVGGEDFETCFQSGIASPVGMMASTFTGQPAREGDWSRGYFEGREAPPLGLREIPAGALWSNVTDLSQFAKMVFGQGRVGGRGSPVFEKPGTLAETLKPQNEDVPLDLDFRIGLGWWLDNQGFEYAGRTASHQGGFPPYRSQLLLALDQKLGVIVLTNSSPGGEVVEKIAVETLKRALEAKTGLRPPEASTGGRRKIPGRPVNDCTGDYNSLIGLVSVRKSDGQWQARMKGHTVYLIPRADQVFLPQYRFLHLFPIDVDELHALRFGFTQIGDHQLLAVRRYGRWLPMGERATPTAIPQAWRDRLGRYQLAAGERSKAIGADVRLGVRDELLTLSYVLLPPFAARERTEPALLPISDDEAVFADGGMVGGETVRVTHQAGTEQLRLFGYELRRVDPHTK